jgi:HEAT repeat protein
MARYPTYQKMLNSPLVVERYWLARALAKSRAAATYSELLSLLKDPHPNVICQVFYALGQRGRKRAIRPIQKKLKDSNHWYAQWYGYHALRKLGWHQRPSN